MLAYADCSDEAMGLLEQARRMLRIHSASLLPSSRASGVSIFTVVLAQQVKQVKLKRSSEASKASKTQARKTNKASKTQAASYTSSLRPRTLVA